MYNKICVLTFDVAYSIDLKEDLTLKEKHRFRSVVLCCLALLPKVVCSIPTHAIFLYKAPRSGCGSSFSKVVSDIT